MRSRLLKKHNLIEKENRIDVIKAKPYTIIGFFLLIGIILLFTSFYVVGIVIVGIFLFYLIGVKNVVLVEFYDSHAVFYLNNGKDECYIIYWNEVDDWEICPMRNDLDVLNITLKDHREITLKCLCRSKIKKYFEKYVHI